MDLANQKVSKILRADTAAVNQLVSVLGDHSNKSGILAALLKENDQIIKTRLASLKLNKDAYASDIFNALVQKVNYDDAYLTDFLGVSDISHEKTAAKVIEFIEKLFPPFEGYFLKKEK